MKRRAVKRKRSGRELGERQLEALTVAMILAPGVYVRNRMFELFDSDGVQRARVRAGVVRGIVTELPRSSEVALTPSGRGCVLRYALPQVHFTRTVELAATELAALRVLLARARCRHLPPSPDDEEIVSRALASLLDRDVAPEVALLEGDRERCVRDGE